MGKLVPQIQWLMPLKIHLGNNTLNKNNSRVPKGPITRKRERLTKTMILFLVVILMIIIVYNI